MLNKILVPLDGSALAECVLPHAAGLARTMKTTVILLRVLAQDHHTDPLQAVDPLNWHLRKAEARAYLNDIRDRLQQTGIVAEVVVLEGSPVDRIVEYARERLVDLILLSSHGYSGLSGWNVSSSVQKIIHRAYTSFLIVRAFQPEPADLPYHRYNRILIPLDGSQRAESVLPVLSSLVSAPQTELVLTYVISRPEMPRRAPLTAEENDLMDDIIARNEDEASRYLDPLRTRLPGEVKIQILVGNNVASALHRLAEQEAVDLVLLSAHGYSADNRFPYGSVVISFIAYGATPLLIMQDLPENYRSQADMIAAQTGDNHGGRVMTYDRPSN
jgi:nucleotide-binding universal stress UspA family protein